MIDFWHGLAIVDNGCNNAFPLADEPEFLLPAHSGLSGPFIRHDMESSFQCCKSVLVQHLLLSAVEAVAKQDRRTGFAVGACTEKDGWHDKAVRGNVHALTWDG